MPYSSLSSLSAIRKILHGGLIALVISVSTGWIYLESQYDIDYAGIIEVLKDELTGRGVTCLDLPEEEWREIPACNVERPSRGTASEETES